METLTLREMQFFDLWDLRLTVNILTATCGKRLGRQYFASTSIVQYVAVKLTKYITSITQGRILRDVSLRKCDPCAERATSELS